MKEYNNFKLYDKVIIVENKNGQGYVVEYGNETMLNSARDWAGTRYNHSNKAQLEKEYEYENGKFKIELKEAANRSWNQGGKLSFWNCSITAPDGKVFLIGINSDLLLDLLKQTTFINGKCDEELYFARRKNQVGIISKHMEEYQQALKDQEIRDQLKSAKNDYKIGDVISSLSQDGRVYLGKIYQYFEIENENSYFPTIKIYKKPRSVFFLTNSINGNNNELKYKDWIDFDTLKTKPKGLITKHYENIDPNKFFEEYINYIKKLSEDRSIPNHYSIKKNCWKELNQFGFDNKSKFTIEQITKELSDRLYYKNNIKVEII